MGRELRRVPADWEHPRDARGAFVPLHDAYTDEDRAEWGEPEGRPESYADYGGRPRTHCQMYEDTSEGTPISPVLETPEQVAAWCADHRVSRFGRHNASYAEWLRVARGGFGGIVVRPTAQDVQRGTGQ